MSVQKKEKAGPLLDGLVQLRFSDEAGNIHDINAAEMAEALQGLVSFTSDMAKSGLFGDGVPPEVRVRPPHEGSFIVEAVLMWAGENPEGAIGSAVTAGGALVQALNIGIKKLRGDDLTDFEYLDNGDVKLNWKAGKVDQIPSQVWDRLRVMKRPTRKSLRNIMAPLSDDVDYLEVREGAANESTAEVLESDPAMIVDRTDYRIAAAEINEVDEEIETFEAEATLKGIDFRPGEKWFIQTVYGSRRATMDDNEFALELDRGMALHKRDLFDVTIREVRTIKNGRTTREWSLIKVVRKRRGGDDDNDESTSANAPDTSQREADRPG